MDFDQISEQVFGAGSEELSSDSLESLQKFLQSLIPSDLSEQNSAGNFRDFLPRILDDWVATDAAPSKLSAQFLVLEWIHQLMSGDEFHDFLKQNSGQLLPKWIQLLDWLILGEKTAPKLKKLGLLILCSSLEWILLSNPTVETCESIVKFKNHAISLVFPPETAEKTQVHPGVENAAIKFLQIYIVTHTPVADGETQSVVDLLAPETLKLLKIDNRETLKTECMELWKTVLSDLKTSWKDKSKGLQRVTGMLNILLPIASSRNVYASDLLELLLELPAQLARRLSWMETTRMKSIKNSLTAYVKSQPVDEDTACTVLTLLHERFHAKIDVHQITQFFLNQRGMKIQVRQAQKEAQQKAAQKMAHVHVEYTYAPEQHEEAVLYGLQQFSQTVQDQLGVTLPVGFDVGKLDTKLIAEMIVQSLSETRMDWDRSVANLKRFTDAFLATQTPLESITIAEQESKAAEELQKQQKKKEIKEFKLEPDADQPSLPPLEALSEEEQSEEKIEEKRESVLDTLWNVCEQVLYQSPIGGQAEKDEGEETFNEVEEKFEHAGKKSEVALELKDVIGLLDNGGANWIFKLIAGETQLEVKKVKKRKAKQQGVVSEEMQVDYEEEISESSTELEKTPSKDVGEIVEEESLEDRITRLTTYWKGSRSFWTVFLSRFIYRICEYPYGLKEDDHVRSDTRFPTFSFDLKYELLVPFLLEDFVSRWDLAVRWLWEEWFHSHVSLKSEEKMERSAYTFWLGHLLDRMFAIANDALPGDSELLFIPWLTNRNQNILFRRFLNRLPLLPKFMFEPLESNDQELLPLPECMYIVRESGIDIQYPTPAILSTLFDITLNRPVPTPLQKLKMILGIDVLYDAITSRPAHRQWLLKKFLNYSTDKIDVRRCEAIRILSRWWTFSAGIRERELEKTNLDGLLNQDLPETIKSRIESGGFFDGVHKVLYSSAEKHAVAHVDHLLLEVPPESVIEELPAEPINGTQTEMEVDASEEKPVEPQNDAPIVPKWNTEAVHALSDLYFVFCSRDPSYCKRLFDIYGDSKTDEMVKSSIEDSFISLFKFYGMPVAPSTPETAPSLSIRLMDVFREHCPPGCETLVLKFLMTVLAPPQEPVLPIRTAQQTQVSIVPPRATKELCDFILECIEKKPAQFSENPLYWIYIINGEEMSRRSVVLGLLSLVDLLLGVEGESEDAKAEREANRELFATTVASLLALAPHETVTQANPYLSVDSSQPLSPYEVFLLFHIYELSPPTPGLPSVPLRKMIEAIQVLLTSPEVSQYFNQRTVCFALQAIIDKYGSRAPPLFMRSVILSSVQFGEGVYPFIVGSILNKCVQFKTLWIGAKMSKNEADYQRFDEEERRRAKNLWSGWIRCLRLTIPQAFYLIPQLSRSQVTLVLQATDSVFNQQLEKWLIDSNLGLPRGRIHAILSLIPRQVEDKPAENAE